MKAEKSRERIWEEDDKREQKRTSEGGETRREKIEEGKERKGKRGMHQMEEKEGERK